MLNVGFTGLLLVLLFYLIDRGVGIKKNTMDAYKFLNSIFIAVSYERKTKDKIF